MYCTNYFSINYSFIFQGKHDMLTSELIIIELFTNLTIFIQRFCLLVFKEKYLKIRD